MLNRGRLFSRDKVTAASEPSTTQTRPSPSAKDKIFRAVRTSFRLMDKLESRVNSLEAAVQQRDARIAQLEAAIGKLRTSSSGAGGAAGEWQIPFMTGNEVRKAFIDFFVEKHDHVFWPSSPVVPHDDPTLLFTNAGMNQFKPVFTGQVDPSSKMAKLKRAVNSQKCIRAGGKHNDLEDVGKDVYHHTCFEMLGNWSFGDFFKREAINMSWQLLTEVYGLDPDRLYASYFGGDPETGLEPDEEARLIWEEIIPASRVIPFDKHDNFWEMGDTGPCGPCSEIHYDRIGGRDASALVNADLPDVIEIWNNVFMQYYRETDGSLTPLPNKHVDTGMGFERIASIVQSKDSNYDTDIFMPIFEAIYALPERPGRADAVPFYAGKIGDEDVGCVDMAYRVVADHIRTLCFAIADGAQPSNEGRGYVLRRVLRRGVRFGSQTLNRELGFFSKLVPTIVDMMKHQFPELEDKQAFIIEVIKDEEESFNRTLDKGAEKLQKTAEKIKAGGGSVFPGETSFMLYDSMGFPYDLTELMVEELGLTMDKEGFDACMAAAKAKSKAGGKTKVKAIVLEAEQTAALNRDGVLPTDDAAKYVWDANPAAVVKAIYVHPDGEVKGSFQDSTEGAEGAVGVVLDVSSFYAEAGGQINDTGAIRNAATGAAQSVENAQTFAGFILHIGPVEGGVLKVGDAVESCVDYERRHQIAPNHTMTHVLNYALRKALNPDGGSKVTVDQKGSQVTEEKLRFDFTCAKPLTPKQITEVESTVQEQIKSSYTVHTQVCSLEQARRISSLRAVFGETYPDPVRVVSVGQEIDPMLADPENAAWSPFSVEFCGGTHLSNTAEAGAFALVEEAGIAKGIRRVSGVTGAAATAAFAAADAFGERLEAAKGIEKVQLEALVKLLTPELDKLEISLVSKTIFRDQIKALVKEVLAFKKAQLKARQATGAADATAAAAKAKEAGTSFTIVRIDVGADNKLGSKMLDGMVKAHPEGSFMIFSADEDKKCVGCYAASSDAAVAAGVDAREWVTAALSAMGGKGGGKDPKQALGQAKKVLEGMEEKVAAAQEAANAFIAGK